MRTNGDHPNIILINCDDLGYGDLGCYGSPVNDTPTLDRMAAEGLRLTDFYMASPVCSPSRGAMMTGCYPPRIGFGAFDDGAWVLFPGHHTGLHRDEITIADLLRGRGYATRIIGKWHCGDQPEFLPTRHGFDGYFGIPFSNDMGRQAHSAREWAYPLPLLRDEEVIEQQPDQASLTERYVEDGVRFIRASAGRPFFLYLAHLYVHLPIYAQENFLRRSRNGPFGGAMACVDWAAAVLQHELRRLGIERNTLIVFTSDNGARGDYGGSNAPLRGRKGTTWEGGQRVPCILYGPGLVPGGRTSSEIVSSLDFLATFAGLAGAEPPSDRALDSLDFGGLLRGRPGARSPRDTFFYYLCNNLGAVRHGRWKLHVARRDGDGRSWVEVRELYNLEADIAETADVAARHPEVVSDLMKRIEACRADLGDERLGLRGANVRPAGWVEDAKPLTLYDEHHPYIQAEYDLPDRG
jgi:arylsulfatase A-like enzyme